MGSPAVAIEDFIGAFARSPLARWRGLEPWQITAQSASIVRAMLAELPRGGNWLAERCTLGPGAELKSSMVFAGTKLAHFNFVGDAILGEDVNLEAGSIVRRGAVRDDDG